MRLAAIKVAQAQKAAQHIGQVGAKYAAVGVDLVDDDVLQVFKELHPFGVVGQDAGVEHIRVGHHDMPRLAYGLAGGAGGVAIVGVGLDAHAHLFDQLVQFADLVGRKRLGGEEIQRTGILVLQNGGQHGQVVAHGFAGGRGGDHHHITPGENFLHRMGLMAVQLVDATLLQHGQKTLVQPFRVGSVLRRAGRNDLPPHHVFHKHGIPPKLIRQLIYIHPMHLPSVWVLL